MMPDRRLLFLIAALSFSALAIAAQTKAPPAPGTRISGTILDGKTQKPAAGVSISMLQGADRKNAVTDAGGQFTFAATHGTVRLIATKSGYASLRPEGHTLPTDGILISLTPGQQLRGLNLVIWPAGSLTATVYDAKSKPIPYARAQLMRYVFDEDGRRTLKTVSGPTGGETNDHGEFRISGADPGEYYLEVDPPLFAERVPGEPFTTTRPVAITIQSGVESHNGDLTLPSVRGGTIHLRLVNQTGERIQNTMTKYLHWNRRNDPGISTIVPLLIMGGPERAEIPLQVGIYSVTAGWMAGSSTNAPPVGLGNAIVEAGATNAESSVVIKKGVHVAGSAVLQPIKGPGGPVANLHCDFTSDTYPSISATSAADGTLSIENVQPGFYTPQCSSSLPDSYVDSIKQGEHDVLKQGLQIAESGESTPFTISIAQSSATIEGKVTTSKGKVAGALVALVPDDPQRDAKNLYRKAYADQNGAYTIHAVAPGAYHVFAWTELDGDAYKNADFMKPYAEQGTPVKVGSGEKKTGIETKLLQ
jgi:hypothetical protein